VDDHDTLQILTTESIHRNLSAQRLSELNVLHYCILSEVLI